MIAFSVRSTPSCSAAFLQSGKMLARASLNRQKKKLEAQPEIDDIPSSHFSSPFVSLEFISAVDSIRSKYGAVLIALQMWT